MTKILEVKGLSKTYNDFALSDVSFSLDKGYIMGFIGPNGAGKSTTIKLIMNLIKRDSGEIKVFGLDNIKNEIEVKNKIGFVYDQNYYYEDLDVRTVKNIISPFYTQWDDKLYDKYMKDFDINTTMKIKNLSKGTKMKFSLAMALSHNAELILMDEPTSGLDPVSRRDILDILQDVIQDENKSIFFSTHITSDLDKTADYITYINDGKVVFSDVRDDILDRYAIVKGGLEILNGELRSKLIGIRENSYGFAGLTCDKRELGGILRESVLFEKPTLEDIMVYTAKGGI